MYWGLSRGIDWKRRNMVYSYIRTGSVGTAFQQIYAGTKYARLINKNFDVIIHNITATPCDVKSTAII
jgi:hypothetical protein